MTIQNVTKQPNGDTVVTFSDGKTITIPKGEKGDAGIKGADGHSITITSNTEEPNGDRKLVFSDNTTVVIPKVRKVIKVTMAKMVHQSQLPAQKQMQLVTQSSTSVMVKCNRAKRPRRHINWY